MGAVDLVDESRKWERGSEESDTGQKEKSTKSILAPIPYGLKAFAYLHSQARPVGLRELLRLRRKPQ